MSIFQNTDKKQAITSYISKVADPKVWDSHFFLVHLLRIGRKYSILSEEFELLSQPLFVG